ncbi:hypothetical protein F2Z20_06270 [Bacteroides finegoldii]|uniref:Uncharacterized protein n=1 Tax=Bacteroides finegoldii TaxID=338188 RepID=A0A7J4YNC7_9BACE|nr:hypothetical protein F2Z28_09545 [Bacteroides finegoldii]KAA5220698.1 hypothetical protein F2Z16_11880 [Bacteroides finegoldii]KAA5226872.1 hypothetical protein F2Z20_06270 [Bacteroides finegoldii]KAA5229985.1 hypothetical protein F2Z22_11520 [Bacteroides finegoldii]KAA5230775.1 hypothetical protein F2Z21_10910 [Bacteroides finegoldii]
MRSIILSVGLYFCKLSILPIIFSECKETEYFTKSQSPFIGILNHYNILNTNYILLFYNTSLGKLIFFS